MAAQLMPAHTVVPLAALHCLLQPLLALLLLLLLLGAWVRTLMAVCTAHSRCELPLNNSQTKNLLLYAIHANADGCSAARMPLLVLLLLLLLGGWQAVWLRQLMEDSTAHSSCEQRCRMRHV
jgi:hypothetical protein